MAVGVTALNGKIVRDGLQSGRKEFLDDLAIAWVILVVTLAEKAFDALVGTERSPVPKAAFALLLLESSPDGLSFFLRLIVMLCPPFVDSRRPSQIPRSAARTRA